MNSFGPVIGIDRGASFTDFGVVHNNTLSETRSLKGRDWESIADVYRQLMKNHKAAQSVFTGSRAGMPDRLAKAVQIIPEIDAIGFGGATLAARDDCIVASIGTGAAIVLVGKVAANRYIRNIVNLVAKLYQTTYIFPENPGYATVYGAALQFRHHRTQVAT